MIRIGITGGIGSGKSTICRIFSLFGIPVFYADDEAKKLYDREPVLREQIIHLFGEHVYPNGKFDRQKMKNIVFHHPGKLAKLNAIVHPMVKKYADEWMQNQKGCYAIKEAALLVESGAYQSLDELIYVSAPEDTRLQRVMMRDRLTANEVRARIRSQMDEAEKIKFAKHIILNDNHQLLIPQVAALHHRFMARCQKP